MENGEEKKIIKNMNDQDKQNKSIARQHGRREHTFALILGTWLICSFIHKPTLIIGLSVLLWTIYHISHRLEKHYYSKCLYDDRTK